MSQTGTVGFPAVPVLAYEKLLWYNKISKINLEFGGRCPLTMRHGLRQSNKIISRPVTSFRSAHGIR